MTDQPIKPDPVKKPKRPRDANQLAKLVVDLATGQLPPEPNFVDVADLGASKGGKARAAKLSAEKRSAIAKAAAAKRWANRPSSKD